MFAARNISVICNALEFAMFSYILKKYELDFSNTGSYFSHFLKFKAAVVAKKYRSVERERLSKHAITIYLIRGFKLVCFYSIYKAAVLEMVQIIFCRC